MFQDGAEREPGARFENGPEHTERESKEFGADLGCRCDWPELLERRLCQHRVARTKVEDRELETSLEDLRAEVQ